MAGIDVLRSASELIDLARKDPRYLAEGGEPYLCHVLLILTSEGKINWVEAASARRAIYRELNGVSFLRTRLRVNGVINHLSDERSPEYSQLAHAFWDALIAKLQVAGN